MMHGRTDNAFRGICVSVRSIWLVSGASDLHQSRAPSGEVRVHLFALVSVSRTHASTIVHLKTESRFQICNIFEFFACLFCLYSL